LGDFEKFVENFCFILTEKLDEEIPKIKLPAHITPPQQCRYSICKERDNLQTKPEQETIGTTPVRVETTMASTFEQFRTKLRTHTPHTTSPSKKYWEKGVDVFEQDRTLQFNL
jgi:hypothetical protein